MVGDSGIGIFEWSGVDSEGGPETLHGRLRKTSNLMKFMIILAVGDESSRPEIVSETLTLAGTDLSDELKDVYATESGSFGCAIRFAQFTGEVGQSLVANVAMDSGTHGYYARRKALLFRTNISFDSLTPVDVKDYKTGTMEVATHTVVENGFYMLFAYGYDGYFSNSRFEECTVNGIKVPFESYADFDAIIVPAYVGDVIRVKSETPYHGCSYGILKVE